MFEIMATGRTHVGKIRTNNEDSYLVSKELGLFLVADGMGGHASGEVASRMAVDIVQETYLKHLHEKDVPLVGTHLPQVSLAANRLLSSIRLANRAIFELAQKEPLYQGMGTTLAGLLAQEDHLFQFHVGDSRIYRLRKDRLEQLTEDHSLVAYQLKMGLLTEEEARTSRSKNVITRAVGVFREVEIDFARHPWQEGDVYLICSDGLSDYVPQEGIRQALMEAVPDLEAAGDALIQRALDKGGHDNITVVLLLLGKKPKGKGLLKGRLGRLLGAKDH